MNFDTKISFLPVQFRYIINLLGRQWMARAVVLVLIVFVASFIFSIISPAAGEAWIYNQTILSGIMAAGFAGLAAALVIGIGVLFASWCISLAFRFAKNDIGITMANERRTAPGALDAWNIYPDIAVFQMPDETESEYAARIKAARQKVTDNCWVVAVEYKRLPIRIDDNTAKGMLINRVGPDSFFPDITDVKIGTETEQEYTTWLSDFCEQWRPFSDNEKVKRIKGNVFGSLSVDKIALVFVFVFSSVFAFGQNTAKISSALGQNDKIVIEGKVVHYVFADGSSVTRTSDGTKTISQLFATNFPGAESRKVGEVVGIDIDNKAVSLQRLVVASVGTADKPEALFADGSAIPIKDKSFVNSLPDSMSVANGLNGVKNQLPFYKSKFYQFFSPVIEFLSYLFIFLSPLFAITLGFFNLVSRSARQNGNLGHTVQKQQVAFAALAWWTAIFLIGSLYLGFTFTMFFWEFHPVLITVLCFAAFYPAKWAINRLTPNGEYQGTMTTTRHVGGGRNSQIGM